jgi:hypothetical protein
VSVRAALCASQCRVICSEEGEEPRKKVPEWAESSALLRALRAQNADPDAIFPDVGSPNLDEIFPSVRAEPDKAAAAGAHAARHGSSAATAGRFRRRASTGNWTRDALTEKENIAYKKKMGYIAPSPQH